MTTDNRAKEKTVIKKTNRKLPTNHPLSRKFDTPEEGAQAKAEYVWNTVLKDIDWDKFDQMRKQK